MRKHRPLLFMALRLTPARLGGAKVPPFFLIALRLTLARVVSGVPFIIVRN
jgi:hypothetical protein